MTSCVAFDGVYVEERDYQGHAYKQGVYDIVVATQFAVVHFKVCQNVKSGKVRVFTDIDPSPLTPYWAEKDPAQRRELLKRHKFFFLSRKNVSARGGNFLGVDVSDTEALWSAEDKRELQATIKGDERAMQGWKVLHGGFDNAPRYGEIVQEAERIVSQERETHLHEKAKTMALVDDEWGMF